MRTASHCRKSSGVVASIAFVLMFLQLQPARPADIGAEGLRAAIDGVYVLEEWHTDTGVFRPPQVDGRFILLNGTVVVFLRNRIDEAKQVTVAAYGSYVLKASEFSYRYDEPSVFTQTSSGIVVSNRPFWEGMRSFVATRDGDNVRLVSQTAEEFLFTPRGLQYSQKGKVQRVWRRITSN